MPDTHDIPPIQVWPFHAAPEKYRALSPFCDDVDWLAFVPDDYDHDYLDWMASGTAFGVCEVAQVPTEGGTLHIGCHA